MRKTILYKALAMPTWYKPLMVRGGWYASLSALKAVPITYWDAKPSLLPYDGTKTPGR